MDQPFSTSKVTVEYYDPYGLYKLIAPGLVARLPLHHLHWQSHAGPLRSIDTLHVELVAASTGSAAAAPIAAPPARPGLPDRSTTRSATWGTDDGFQTASIGGRDGSSEDVTTAAAPSTLAAVPTTKERRHQIPGLRRTPYLKVLLIRCDSNESYKAQARGEIREWVKQHATMQPRKKGGVAENHDAFEWMVVHVVIPNSAAYAQPRTSRPADGATDTSSVKSGTHGNHAASSRWGKSSATLLERMRADFNGTGGKATVERVAQIRVDVRDIPYELLPLVVSAAPGGSQVESAQEVQAAWQDLLDTLKARILASFDVRVTQYEEDIREKDLQRMLPGWNFCTFFMLKEGLARGFESVGLVEDALVGYDELSVGLDTVVREQEGATTGTALPLPLYTDDLQALARRVRGGPAAAADDDDTEPEDLQGGPSAAGATDPHAAVLDAIPLSATRKPYRELILANNVSVFDFRCYIFARQVALLLRLGNAWATREELLARLREQQAAVLPVAAPPPVPAKGTPEAENLPMLAEICRRALEFIPALARVMREDLLRGAAEDPEQVEDPAGLVDNMVASYAFSIAQQILAQTATDQLPVAAVRPDDTHPARRSSLQAGPGSSARGPPSPGVFPSAGSAAGALADMRQQQHKTGLEELAARRADLYMLSRGILEEAGKRRGWTDGWASAPAVGAELEEVDLEGTSQPDSEPDQPEPTEPNTGTINALLLAALDAPDAFARLYETLTDQALRLYTLAGHAHAVHAALADLAVLKYHERDYAAAAAYFYETTPFFGSSSWDLLELSMLVMYADCLRALGRTDEYAWRLLKLLTKAAEVEKDRLAQAAGRPDQAACVDLDALRGHLPALLAAAQTLKREMRVPLASVFSAFDLASTPVYDSQHDCFDLVLRFHSLLPEALPVNGVRVRMLSAAAAGASAAAPREIWLEATGPQTLAAGRGTLRVRSTTVTPGLYALDQVRLTSGNVAFVHEQNADNRGDMLFAAPCVVVYQPTSALDVQLSTSKTLQLDRNNHLEVALATGRNALTSCTLHIRAATGGLRLLTAEARVVDVDDAAGPAVALDGPVQGGVLTFGAIAAGATVRIAFPFSMEQDVLDLCVKVDVTYTTAAGTFQLSKAPSVATALALGVNVQDVFKHARLFSRFTVSTATASPLRLLRSELIDSDLFAAACGPAPDAPPMVFPQQPASLLYRIVRKQESPKATKLNKTMHIRLHYSVLQDEMDAQLAASLAAVLHTPALYELAKTATAAVQQHLHATLTPADLERATLLGALSTACLASVDWAARFPGLGCDAAGADRAAQLAAAISSWQGMHPVLPLEGGTTGGGPPPLEKAPTILIPVDIPSMTIVHTADIRLRPVGGSSGNIGGNTGDDLYAVNQLLTATLQLRWTRAWDTTGAPLADLEFSFEVTAPTDTWLVGGRRKGHFVIPAPDADAGIGLSSTPASEAAIPLTLIPLRAGWLPYPSVEIREVHSGAGEHGEAGLALAAAATAAPRHHCETDYRNLGETVHVVPDRRRVTLSLDASGPGGGPLVLESEQRGLAGELSV